MKSKIDFVKLQLKEIKKKNLYRELKNGNVNGSIITINGRKLINLSSNDYLGISVSKKIIGQIQSSSRLISGNDSSFDKLEKKLAKHKSQESSLIFPTGYMANLGAISALIGKNDLILSDEYNHASIIEACKLSGARVSIYKHNDVNDLELKMKNKKRKFVVTEGIFSMDGDSANLKKISNLAHEYDAITILDDAHGDFTVGIDGKGTPELFDVSGKIDLYISSLSKGLGSFGGYVASKSDIVKLLLNKSKSFIYTSALPSFIVQHALAKFNANREMRRKKLWENVRLLSSGLEENGYEISSKSHIIPIIIGKERDSLEIGKFLVKNGIFAQPIRYPTVRKNKARIRISVTAWLSKDQINDSLIVFEKAAKKFKIT